MKKLLLAIASFSFLFISNNVSAETRATSCHGCNAVQMSTQATNVAGVGVTIVYVFNQNTKSVNKYEVYTSAEDGPPFSITKEANQVAVELDINDNYRVFINDILYAEDRTIILPPDFPIHSSAGALLSPPSTYQYMRGYLGDLPGGWILSAKQLLVKMLALNMPYLDFGALMPTSFTLTVQFPDGSQMDFKIEFSYNLLRDDLEVDPTALSLTATDQDGNPIPVSQSDFAGRSFNNNGGGLQDWVSWAGSRGISVSGSGGSSGGSTMTCVVKSNGTYSCTLKQ